jgi:hypothetical protein
MSIHEIVFKKPYFNPPKNCTTEPQENQTSSVEKRLVELNNHSAKKTTIRTTKPKNQFSFFLCVVFVLVLWERRRVRGNLGLMD